MLIEQLGGETLSRANCAAVEMEVASEQVSKALCVETNDGSSAALGR